MPDHHPLAGPVYKGTTIRTPAKMLTGSGAPSFCWHCGSQLQRAPGKELGLFFFNLVNGPDGELHRIHGDCTERAILDGCKLVPAQGVPAQSPTQREKDMALMLKRMCRRLQPDDNMREAVTDYLRREGLLGSPLREGNAGVGGTKNG